MNYFDFLDTNIYVSIKSSIKLEVSEDSPSTILDVFNRFVKAFHLILLLFVISCIESIFFLFLSPLKLLNLEDFSHFHLLLVEFLQEVFHLLHLGVVRVQGIQVICELVRPISQAVDTYNRIFSNGAFLVVGVATSEMNGSLSPGQGVAASSTVGRCSKTVELLAKVIQEDSLEAELNQVRSQV